MIIAYNAVADYVSRNFQINNRNKIKAMERLSSGYRINRAADDAAGLAISEKLRGQIRGLERAAKNVQDGISFCQTADGALNEVHNILGRIKELSVQAANDVCTDEDRGNINDEIKQLKKELNRISGDTEFNKKKIFAIPYEIEFSREFKVVKIFDATNGDPDDPNSYGGIILSTPTGGEDTRIAWKEINPNMVKTDPVTGEVVFNEGTYRYDGGFFKIDIECKEGSKPPEIKVTFPVTADEKGINIAGEHVDWRDVLNEDDESILDHIGEGGFYHFKSGDGIGCFYIPEFDSLDDVINGIDAANARYERKYVNEYSGYDFEQAVDIIHSEGSSLRVNSALYNMLINNHDMDMRLKADESGIWIVTVNADGSDGAEVRGSKKTWEDMGIRSWDSMGDISDKKQYEYRFNEDGYDIKFDFKLLDETSIDSVIEGINDASLRDTLIRTNNDLNMGFTAGNGLTDGRMTGKNVNVDIYDEAALGRNFDVQSETFSNGTLTYDAATDEFVLTFPNKASGDPELTFGTSQMTSQKTIEDKARAYESYFTARQVQALLSGKSASFPTLEDVIGGGSIQEGEFVFNGKMNSTQGLSGTYSAVELDFSGMGTAYEIYDLLGTGFNSTCATCDNHYSVLFVWGDTDKTTSDGYGYSMFNDGQNNYTLMVDIKSMMDKGIAYGEQFANALVDVMNEAVFDFHYQQYAADGSSFYVCDERHNSLGSFDTKPYEVESCTIDVRMADKKTGKGGFDLSYTYDFKQDLSPFADKIEDANGEFVDDGKGGLKRYNYYDYHNLDGTLKWPNTSEPVRYNVEVRGRIASWPDYYDQIMQNIANQTSVAMESTDYDYVDYTANERENQATVSQFDFYIEDTRAFWIQAGANKLQGIVLDWDGFSTYTLGIGMGDTLTRKNSEQMLSDVDTAIAIISSIRSDFGAFTNRLEFAYANDKNAAENLQSAESKLRDADMAQEAAEFSKHNILEQAASSLLSQANQMTQGVLRLLQ